MKRKICFIYLVIILSLILTSLVYGKEAGINTDISPALISVGEVYSEWCGVLEIPIWANTNAFLAEETTLMVEEKIDSFQFKVDWRGNNTSKFDEKAIIIIKLEKESYPYSGKWELLYEKGEEITCKSKSLDLRKFMTPTIIQKEPEVRYKFVVRADLPIGPSSGEKTTFVTIRFSSGSTYTYLPYLLLTILHDPNGDKSYTGITSQATLEHTLCLKIDESLIVADIQPEFALKGTQGQIEFKPLSRYAIKAIYIPAIDLKSELNSSDASLIGSGLGDIYVIAKNIPLKLSFSKAKKGRELYFKVVSPQEAGLPPGKEFDIITIPAAVLRSYEEGRPIFGSWSKFEIDSDFRTELIDKNIGWDNRVTLDEHEKVIDLGQAYLNAKEKITKFRYKQQPLLPVTLKVSTEINPAFTQVANIMTKDGKTPAEILLNHEIPGEIVPNKNMLVEFDDKDCKTLGGDFFTYHAYVDRQFGTLLFITEDDKTKPANLSSLHCRSLSSNPSEYWTGKFEVEEKIVTAEVLPPPKEEIKMPVAVPSVEEVKPSVREQVPPAELKVEVPKEILPLPKVPVKLPPAKEEVEVIELPKLPEKEKIIPPEIIPPTRPEKEIEVAKVIPPKSVEEVKPSIKEQVPPAELKVEVPKEILPLPEVPVKLPPAKEEVEVIELPKFPEKEKIIPPEIIPPTRPEKEIEVAKVIPPKSVEEVKPSVREQVPPAELKVEVPKEILPLPKVPVKLPPAKEKVISEPPKPIVSKKPEMPKEIPAKVPVKEKVEAVKDEEKMVEIPEEILLAEKEIEVAPVIPPAKEEVEIIELPKLPEKEKIIPPEIIPPTRPEKEIEVAKVLPPKEEEIPPQIVEEVKKEVSMPPPEIPEIVKAPLKKKMIMAEKLMNSDFSLDLQYWKKIETAGGKKILNVIYDTYHYSKVLEFKRIGSIRERGEFGVYQSLNLDVSKSPSLIVGVDVKLIFSSLNSDEGEVYPAMIELEYEDVEGNVNKWKHGFLYDEPFRETRLNHLEIGEKIPKNRWYSYSSPDLMKILSPQPKLITQLKIYGAGMGFKTRIDNVKLVVEEAPTVAPLEKIPMVVTEAPPSKEEIKAPPVEEIKPPLKKELPPSKIEVRLPPEVPPPPPKEEIKAPPVEEIKPPLKKELPPSKIEVTLPPEVPPPPLKEEIKAPPVEEIKPPLKKELPPSKIEVRLPPEVPPPPPKEEIKAPPVEEIKPPLKKELPPSKIEVRLPLEVPPPPQEELPPVKPEIAKVLPKKEVIIQPEKVALPATEEIIIPLLKLTNSDFKEGLTHWKKIEIGPGKKEIGIIKESILYPNVLEFTRSRVGKERGKLGVSQLLNMDISEYVYVVIKADVKVISASMKNDGAEGGDYPVTIELEYEDAQGNIKSFKHGFLYQKQINYPIGECIGKDKWSSYTSPNLMEFITPKPRLIKEVQIYGSGMEFKGRVANFQLDCKEILPLPELPIEVAITAKIPQKEVLLPEAKTPEIIPLLPPVQPPKLLNNGNFTVGLKDWEKIETGKGINKIGVMKDSDDYPNVLEFTRVATEEGKVGVSQSLWMPVANFISLVVMADVKVLYSSFFGDKFVEQGYPLILEIEYMDMEGKTQLWRKGFKYQGKITVPESEEMVIEKAWHPFTSTNLIKQLSPKPNVITKIKVYGCGWGFWARITNIQLIGE